MLGKIKIDKIDKSRVVYWSKVLTASCLLLIFLSIGLVINIFNSSWFTVNDVYAESRQSEISNEIKNLNSKITSYQSLISEFEEEEKSLEEEQEALDEALKEIKSQKNQAETAVNENLEKIDNIQEEIENYIKKEEELKTQLSQIIRIIYEYQEESSITMILGSSRISEVMNKMENVANIQENLNNVVDETQRLKNEQKEAQKVLASKQEELEVLYRTIAEQETDTKALINHKESLIQQSNSNQKEYESRLVNAKKVKDSLAKELTLLGSGGKITFEMAVASAKRVGGLTGVRPALLLGVLKQETNFGANVGTATYHTAYRGASAEKNIVLFKKITAELGLDPEKTKVSAWPGYGSGGAMGPCQFMPQTWMGYRDKVKELNGSSIPNPWNLDDCLTAMGVKLANAGAASQNYNDEWKAVAMYFAGSNWNNPKFSFYPNNVLALAEAYEKQI